MFRSSRFHFPKIACVALTAAWFVPAVVKSSPAALHSPAAEEVAPRDAWPLAEAYAAARGGCDTLVGRGNSMLPLYRDRTVIVVERLRPEQWKHGMTVVYFGTQGQMVAHVLIERTPRGWVAQGLGNGASDRTLVKPSNYVGTVIKAFTPNPSVKSTRDVSSRLSPSVVVDGALVLSGQ